MAFFTWTGIGLGPGAYSNERAEEAGASMSTGRINNHKNDINTWKNITFLP